MPTKSLKRKKQENGSKKSKPKKTLKKVALLPLVPHQKAIPFKLQVAKRRKKLEMPPKLPAIAATRRVIMSKTVLRQKTSCNLGDFYVVDCKHGG